MWGKRASFQALWEIHSTLKNILNPVKLKGVKRMDEKL
jgi:hypothetical protein